MFSMSQGPPPKTYDLEILIQPPAYIPPNTEITPTIVVALKVLDKQSQSSGGQPRRETYGVWAYASLTKVDGDALGPPMKGVLHGKNGTSIQPAEGRPNLGDPTLGYAVFSNLTITQPGEYQFLITLIQMDSHGGLYGQALQGGRNLQSISSNVIAVHPAAGPRQLSKNYL